MAESDNRVGDAIRGVMKEKGFSQDVLALVSGIRQPNLSKIICGHAHAGGKTLERIAKALGVEVSAFFPPQRGAA